MITTLNPKRAGYLPQIQSIIKAVRPYWLSLPGSVSHEVGHDSEAGTIVIVETCTSELLLFHLSLWLIPLLRLYQTRAKMTW